MLDPVVNAARILWEFYNVHKDPVNLLLTTAFSGFGLTGLNWWREKQQKRRRARIAGDSLPFRVVRPNQDVFPAIFGRERAEYLYPSLIDWDIPLQDRELDINHLAEIIRLLNDDQWVIITGPAGIGKTREMAEVALRFIRRGWTVMVFTGTLEGDQFPREQFLDVRRNVLFIFDDLHIQMRRSQPTRENRATEEQSLPTDRPLQERLLAALDHCDSVHIPDTRIKVLATARDETVSDDPRLVSPWEMLQWERYPLWRRFTRYRLPRPENQAAASWLVNVSNRTGIQLECPPEEIAQRNDGTFQNLVNNFEILLAGDSQEGRSLSLSRENFKDTLRGSWKKCYQDAFKLEPLAKELYDAVDLLQQANIPLKAFVVERVALMLVRGNRWQKVRYQWRIKKALEKLEAREGILSPRDGQIEGKGELLSLEDYLEKLLGLFLALLDRFPLEVKEALDKVSNKLYDKENYTESLRGYDALVKYFPKDENFQLMRGNNLYYLVRYADALDCFNQATEIKPDYFRAWTNKGLIIQKIDVLEGVEKEATALEYYDRALAINPDDALTLVNKGLLLGELGKKEEALELYKQAINNDPNYYRAYYAQGLEFSEMNRYEESISAYAQAIEVKPDFVAAWVGKGNQLANLGRYEEALSAYEEAIRLKPDYDYAWNGKGNQLANLGRYEEALSAYDEAIRIVPNDPTPRLAKCSALVFLEQFLEALVCSDKLIEIDPEDITFLNIRAFLLGMNDNYMESKKIYQEILESNPNFLPAYFTSSIVKYKQEQYSQALDSISQCLMIEELNSQAWYMKAQILISLERFQEAFECFDRSLEIDSDYILCIYDKAYYQRLYGDYNKAISGFSLVIEHCQSELSRKKLDSNHWYVYCASLSYIKNYVLCLEQIAEALLRNPENAGIYFIIARHDALEENIDQSLANLKTAIKKSKHWQKAAIKEPDFDKIRQDPRFIELISDNF